MTQVYSDFDCRLLSALTGHPLATPRTVQDMTDAQVLRAMAKIWVASGGEAAALTEEYIIKLRAEIARMEKGAA